jgi:hypothetical protein
MEHVDTVGGLALGLASGTGELDAQKCEDRLTGELVPHLHEPGVKVDLAREGADCQKRGGAHDHERRDGLLSESKNLSEEEHRNKNQIRELDSSLMSASSTGYSSSSDEEMIELPEWASTNVKESWIDVGSLLEDNDVSSGALGGRDLPENTYAPKTGSERAQIERLLAAIRIL